MKFAPLVSQPTEIWSQLAAVVCKEAPQHCPHGVLVWFGCWSCDDEEPTVIERPQTKEGGESCR